MVDDISLVHTLTLYFDDEWVGLVGYRVMYALFLGGGIGVDAAGDGDLLVGMYHHSDSAFECWGEPISSEQVVVPECRECVCVYVCVGEGWVYMLVSV